MRNIWLWLSVLILVLFMVREFYPGETPSAPLAPPPKQVQRPPAPPARAEPKQNPPIKLAPPTLGPVVSADPAVNGKRPKPPPNSVPFEVRDGLVVSFGDVLLGRPTHADFPPNGFIEAPKLQLWTGGVVGYSFDPRLVNPQRVQRVIEYFNENTPIKFVPYTDQKDSIVFSPSEIPLCLSYVGRIGGHQPIYLDDRCLEREITHELMHALGFIHEHSRPDRDRYLRVNWDKIEEDKVSQFEVAPVSLANSHKDRPFDYQSVMIYDPTDFAKQRGETTMESTSGAKIAPTPNGISAEDFNRLILLYGQ